MSWEPSCGKMSYRTNILLARNTLVGSDSSLPLAPTLTNLTPSFPNVIEATFQKDQRFLTLIFIRTLNGDYTWVVSLSSQKNTIQSRLYTSIAFANDAENLHCSLRVVFADCVCETISDTHPSSFEVQAEASLLHILLGLVEKEESTKCNNVPLENYLVSCKAMKEC